MSITFEDIMLFSSLATISSKEDSHKDYLRCMSEELLPHELVSTTTPKVQAIMSKVHGYELDERIIHIRKVNSNLNSDLLDEFIKEFKRMYILVKNK